MYMQKRKFYLYPSLHKPECAYNNLPFFFNLHKYKLLIGVLCCMGACFFLHGSCSLLGTRRADESI